jgi:aryl-alcohol dehydrogenase-like predicted oxidoreductase
LASGYLTGKYSGGSAPASPRSATADRYRERGGERVIDAMRTIADRHAVAIGAVALAWLAHQPTVVAPIASARTPAQLAEISAFAELTLDTDELAALDDASRCHVGVRAGAVGGNRRW